MLALTLLCLMQRTSALSAATAASAAGPEGPCSRPPWWGAVACRQRQHETAGERILCLKGQWYMLHDDLVTQQSCWTPLACTAQALLLASENVLCLALAPCMGAAINHLQLLQICSHGLPQLLPPLRVRLVHHQGATAVRDPCCLPICQAVQQREAKARPGLCSNALQSTSNLMKGPARQTTCRSLQF